MSLVMKLVGLVLGVPSEHDGRYVVDYDPTTLKSRGFCHLVTTEDVRAAKVYEDLGAVHAEWTRSIGTRPDGKPDRPLTAFTFEVVQVCAACGKTKVDCDREKDEIAAWNEQGSCEFGPDCDGTRCKGERSPDWCEGGRPPE